MSSSVLRAVRAALLPLTLTLLGCGAVEPGAADPAAQLSEATEVGETAAALSVQEIVRLDCGRINVSMTRAAARDEDRDVAEDDCADQIRAERPSVRCAACEYDGACKPLTRRSDIIQNCELRAGVWYCTCAQRSFLGCYPCVRPDNLCAPEGGCGAVAQ